MNTYPAYKDSGEQWLGHIPEHWEILPGMAVLEENKVKNRLGTESTVLSLSYGKIIVKANKDEGLVPAEYTSYQIVHPDYIIIRCTDLQNDKVSLRTGIVKNDGIITSAYLGLIVKDNNPQFIHYYLHALDITKEIYRYGNGLRQSLSWEDFKRLNIIIPPLNEQEAIVSYLDEQTGKIDQAIEREQKMIDLLEERKQIIIQQAVTKGLNPNAPMKDSGEENLGMLPSHWIVKRLGVLGTFSKGGNISRDDLQEDGTYDAILYGDIYTKYNYVAKDIRNHIYSKTAEQAVSIKGGVLLMAGSGETKEDIGKTVYYQGDGAYVGGDVIIFQQNKNNGMFLSYALNSQYAKEYRYRSSKGEIVVHIYPYALKNLYLAIPPIEEQQDIVAFLDEKMGNIDRAIEAREKLISLFRERKQIIINEVVTGKIKVS